MSRSSSRVIALILVLSATGISLRAQQEPEPGVSEQTAEPTPEVEGLDWQRELDAIADLLIDGQALEAKARAEDLLQAAGLPQEATARSRVLRDKAEAKLIATPASLGSRPTIEIPARDEKTEGVEKVEIAKVPQLPAFKVRVARVGSGFGEGTSGVLQFSETGLSFVRTGQSRPDWSIRFKDLAEARGDDGLWDAPFSLVLIERGGRKHYLVHTDARGNYLQGRPILSAIEQSSRKHKAPKAATPEKDP